MSFDLGQQNLEKYCAYVTAIQDPEMDTCFVLVKVYILHYVQVCKMQHFFQYWKQHIRRKDNVI